MTTKRFLYLNEFGDALLIHHEGEDTLTTLQTLVEGWVQPVPTNAAETGFEGDVWVNEEGLGVPTFAVNLLASMYAGTRLVGPAVIAKFDSETGETLGLTEADLRGITSKGLMVDDNNSEGWTPKAAADLRGRIVSASLN
jgi:hypothetical protein